ncbi:c-Myc-binding protein [Rhipicephalus microplus]|uniref:Putative c myc binding protein n=1 Tax=Rhipicephalus microplus TaxID=6941 RepID=A0A6G5ABF3_RHIMP
MTSYRTFAPVDSKKEDFRKYIEKSGLLERMTLALVSLFEEQERPENAIAYFKSRFDPDSWETSNEAMKKELEQVRRQLEELQIEHNLLKMQMAKGVVEEAVVAEPEQ